MDRGLISGSEKLTENLTDVFFSDYIAIFRNYSKKSIAIRMLL